MKYDLSPTYVPARPEYVLAVFRDQHRQDCSIEYDAEPQLELTFDTTIAEWRFWCDLLDWRRLGRALDNEWKLGGRPRIDGHRIQVEDIAIWHERRGMSPDQIVSEYPSITLADVHAALAYYYEHRARIDADIESAKKYAEEMRAKAGPSRLEAS